MKKLLTFIMCIVLAIGVMSFAACGDSTFKGNYEEVDKATAAEFAESVNGDSSVLDMKSGMEMEFSIESESDEFSFSMEYDLKCAYNAEQQMEMEGSVKGKGEGQTIKGDIYYSNGLMYINSDGMKIKQAVDYEEFLEGVTGMGSSAIIDIEGAMTYLETDTTGSIKVYLDKGETESKFKLEVNNFSVEGVKVNGEYYYVFDANGNLIACKIDVSMTMSYEGYNSDMSVYMVVKAYDGKISLPSDLDSYQLGQLPL